MTLHSPPADGSPPKRPRGILKNRSTSNANAHPPPAEEPAAERPTANRELSEREIVLANTLHNAGPHRRSSSTPRGLTSRRQSGSGANGEEVADENSPRLKWDEANLYLAEQDRGTHMKITEPKTPYAKQYDPAEDDVELTQLNAEELLVDEVDKKHAIETGAFATPPRPGRAREEDIPGLDLGEPEVDTVMRDNIPTPESEKRVMVDTDMVGDEGYHGETDLGNMSEEEKEKHKRFEELRKRHYEMRNVKNLLGHPDQLDGLDDDEASTRPPAPQASS